MKRSWIAAFALLIALPLAAPAAATGRAAVVEQGGNGQFTVLTQNKGRTAAVTYNNMSQHKVDKLVPFITRERTPTAGRMGGASCGSGLHPLRGGANSAVVNQAGIGNNANIKQAGTGNRAVAVQIGTNNKSYIVQKGNAHSAQTMQAGSNNTAVILQRC